MAQGIPLREEPIQENSTSKQGSNMKRAQSTPNLSATFTSEILEATGNHCSQLRQRKNELLVKEQVRQAKLTERQKWELKYRQTEMRRNNPAAWYSVGASRAETAIDEKKRVRSALKQNWNRSYS